MTIVDMVLGTMALMLCLMPLVVVYGGFTLIMYRVNRFGPMTDSAKVTMHEMQKMDLVLTITPVLPTIFVGYLWHTWFCYDLLFASMVFPYQEVFRWVWFFGLVVFVGMMTNLERRTRRAAVNRTIVEDETVDVGEEYERPSH